MAVLCNALIVRTRMELEISQAVSGGCAGAYQFGTARLAPIVRFYC
jgi:hypothetical protein